MALSLERRYARVVRSLVAAREQLAELRHQRSILADDLRDARADIRRLQREEKERDRASTNTLDKLFASVQYALNHLYDADDLEAATKLGEWLGEMRGVMLPVADIREIIDLLEEWRDVVPSGDGNRIATLYMRTQVALNEITGKQALPEVQELPSGGEDDHR